ncbi:MAG: tRNA 4-thiouridine(8) synthase ThiI [Desulfobacterales bacterium]|nr:tRNA 4-thiouridine(8) synthase ThiI [Desulfobacterales bacterium]
MVTKNTKVRAVGLLSGGLDSTLATRLMLDQGIEVFAVNFTSPFCTCTPKSAGCPAVVTAISQLGDIPLKRIRMGSDYLEIVKKPKFGYGAGMNPCIDCRILKIKKAGEYMHKIGASFLFTGEVLGQRPMSQHRRAVDIINRESGLKDYILRPLSAAHFEPTVPEQKGWVDRSRLLGISGRSRKPQILLASRNNITDYPCPAGGCLLTVKNFAERMRDYFAFTDHPSLKDVELLKVGRHFRLQNHDKVIVARDEMEGQRLESLHGKDDHLLVPFDFAGPTVYLCGSGIQAAAEKMVHFTKQALDENHRDIHRCGRESKTVRLHGLLSGQAGISQKLIVNPAPPSPKPFPPEGERTG